LVMEEGISLQFFFYIFIALSEPQDKMLLQILPFF